MVLHVKESLVRAIACVTLLDALASCALGPIHDLVLDVPGESADLTVPHDALAVQVLEPVLEPLHL